MYKTVSDGKWDETRNPPLENKTLKDKVAVIYGAAGAVGSTAVQAFAREGASVFLTGRSTSKLNKVAQEISSADLSAEVAEVDALDEQDVNHHLEKTFEKTGRIDISFNATGIPLQGVEGTPLVKLPTESFLLPISIYTKSQFITAKAARGIYDPKEIWSYPFPYAKPRPYRSRLLWAEWRRHGLQWRLYQEIFHWNSRRRVYAQYAFDPLVCLKPRQSPFRLDSMRRLQV